MSNVRELGASAMPSSEVIPTISAAISCLSMSSGEEFNGEVEKPLTAKEIVQRKFKDNEIVLSIFEAYQIIGQEHTSRLLALVVSEISSTYAVFALTATRLPPRSCNELTIDKVFPLNESFQIGTDKKGISRLQFEMKTSDQPAVQYFYYPIITSVGAEEDFLTFQGQVLSAQMKSMQDNSALSYSWLNDYRQIGEVRQELLRREHEYIVYKDFNIYCATWNVNNKTLSYDSSLYLWLSACDTPPDIYAIALQELATSATATAFNEDRPDPLWIKKYLESVYRDEMYEELCSKRLVGMMLTIIIRRQIRPYVARCRVKSIACGIMNTLGNKGGVAVSLQLNEGNICFVNSHLAAHLNLVEQRNEDYRRIVKDLVFDDELRRTINDHDHIFWIGDLNYRLSINDPMDLQQRWASGSFEKLLKMDQLRQEMRKGNCFEGYSEGTINFRPTYKYDTGTDDFDSSEKQRIPAYCDRILWKGPRVEQLAYNSVMEMRQSDHKPVYAIFKVKVKTKDEKLYKRVHEEVLKLVDKRENENQPQIIVESTVVDFGQVRFNEMAVRDFTVSNKCPMPVDFMFKVKDPPLNDICEKWLHVEPRAETLLPDTTKNIRIKLMADMRSIRGLLKKIRTTNYKFDFDILVLHVKNGRDIFITITGEYKPSCFGLSMETLCRTDRPLCDYSQEQIRDLMNDESNEYRISMPRELFMLVDFILKQGNKVEGVFANWDNKPDQHFNAIKEWLDTWSQDKFPGTPQAAANALLMLLDLPEKPLLDLLVDALLETSSVSEAEELVSLLSSPRCNVFVYLCMFLRDGIEKNYYNQQQVANVFGRVLLRKDENSNIIGDKIRSREFMYRMLSGPGGAAGALAQN